MAAAEQRLGDRRVHGALFRFRWIILYAIGLHCIWGVTIILAGDTSMQTTALGELIIAFQPVWLAMVFFAVALAAIVALVIAHPVLSAMLMMPQQFLLLLSAASAVDAMIRSQFGDGVIRPRTFIIADQAPIVLAALAHTGALTESFFRRGR